MKLKIIYHYEEIIEDLTKITVDEFGRIDIDTKTRLSSIPGSQIKEIIVLKD